MKNDAAPAGDNTLNGLASLGMFFQGLVLHFLNHFKTLGLRAFFFRNGLVNTRWHDNVFARAGDPIVESQLMQGLGKGLAGRIQLGIVARPPQGGYGWIAQLVEQRTENQCVPGSNPGPATISFFPNVTQPHPSSRVSGMAQPASRRRILTE